MLNAKLAQDSSLIAVSKLKVLDMFSKSAGFLDYVSPGGEEKNGMHAQHLINSRTSHR